MLDIKLIREKLEIVKNNLAKRGENFELEILDKIVDHDKRWRSSLTKVNNLRHERRKITNKIADLKKSGKSISEEIKNGRKLDLKIATLEKQMLEHKQKVNYLLMRTPNLLHESVPLGQNENDNIEVKIWNKPPSFSFRTKNHLEIAKNLGILDDERGAKVSGHGFFYLKNDLVLLDMALQRFAVEHIISKGYQLIKPPFMMRRKPYEGVTDLADFENVMYKIENEDLYMIATAEHPIAAMYTDEVLLKDDLPKKLIGISSCFRKEVGAHGKYTRGLFRMHQFNKIEQFIFCLPKNSWSFHEEIQRNAEELYELLGLHYKVVNVCTGDIGSIAAKRYDINLWMADGVYREAGSNSNCTDYQARRLNIRYREKLGQPPKGFVHTINNTALATSRTMLAILEQFQQEDGSVIIPEVLWSYMNGLKKLELH